MISAKLPDNEKQRLSKLKELDILDTIGEQAYDDLTQLAATICEAPIALVSLVDESRQWFKSHHGLDATETPRDVAFCAHAIHSDDLFLIEDAEKDDRFHDNPLVTNPPHVKFYAGAPLVLETGIRVGTLCVIDHHARKLSDDQKTSLMAISRQAVSLLQLRLRIDELKKLDKAKDTFLSLVSHELRTPLTSLKGSIGIIKHFASDTDEQMTSMLDIATRNSDQLLAIVNDILDLAKMESGEFNIEMDSVDIVSLMKEALAQNESYINQCCCQAVLELPEDADGIFTQGDKLRLIQVITNLLSNAAKFSPEGAQIKMRLEVIDKTIRVSITDNGTGIAVDQQDQLFNKFRQLGKPRKELPGTGLDLSICKHIIEAHHGTIGFHSIPNQETVFYFDLGIISNQAT